MDAVFSHGLINAALAAAFTVAVAAITFRWRNPYVGRVLWLAVLLRFVAPPLVGVPLLDSLPDSLDAGRGSVATAKSGADARQPESELGSTDVSATGEVPTVNEVERRPTRLGDAPTGASHLSDLSPALGRLKWGWHGLVMGWCLGALALAATSLWRIARFHRLIRQTTGAPESLRAKLQRIARRLRIARTPQLRLTEGVTPPLVWSLGGRPTIVLPARLIRRLDDAQITSILAHEAMHVRRRDSCARWLELVVVCLFWWCPVAWIARRRVQLAEERSCDADVLQRFPELRSGYATALAETLEFLSGANRGAILATGFAQRAALKRRFEMIVSSRLPARPTVAIRAGLLLIGVAVLGMTPSTASDNAETDTKTGRVGRAVDAADVVERCTITLADGRRLEGEVISRNGDRIVIRPDQEEPVARPHVGDSGAVDELGESWNLSLEECVAIGLEHSSRARLTGKPNSKRRRTLSDDLKSDRKHRLEASEYEWAQTRVRDIEDLYWELWLARKDVVTVNFACDEARAFWRSLLEDSASDTPGVGALAQALEQHEALRKQRLDRRQRLVAIESRLRYALGLSASDGRLIRASGMPRVSAIRIDWPEIHNEALTHRLELVRQREEVENRRRTLVQSRETGRAEDRLHEALLLEREIAVLEDMELEVSYQLADAERHVDTCYRHAKTTQSRNSAMQDEVENLATLVASGNERVDNLLLSRERAVDAEHAYYRAMVDYVHARNSLRYRSGTLLARYGFVLAGEE